MRCGECNLWMDDPNGGKGCWKDAHSCEASDECRWTLTEMEAEYVRTEREVDADYACPLLLEHIRRRHVLRAANA